VVDGPRPRSTGPAYSRPAGHELDEELTNRLLQSLVDAVAAVGADGPTLVDLFRLGRKVTLGRLHRTNDLRLSLSTGAGSGV